MTPSIVRRLSFVALIALAAPAAAGKGGRLPALDGKQKGELRAVLRDLRALGLGRLVSGKKVKVLLSPERSPSGPIPLGAAERRLVDQQLRGLVSNGGKGTLHLLDGTQLYGVWARKAHRYVELDEEAGVLRLTEEINPFNASPWDRRPVHTVFLSEFQDAGGKVNIPRAVRALLLSSMKSAEHPFGLFPR
jgi:hypothetical protein